VKKRLWLFMFICAVMASGCATITAPSYSPDYSVLDSIKRQKLSKLAIGSVEPKNPSDKVNSISLRGAALVSPSGSYAKYLEDALISDLAEARILDQNSLSQLSLYLLNNNIDIAGFSSGYGTIEALFSIKRGAVTLFNKTITAKTEFESSFAGAVALPKGQNEYPNLVRALLKKLYTDKEFINVLQN